MLPGAPTIYQAILDHPDRDEHDLSSLRVAVTGAADIPVELIRRIHDELPFSTIITGYGLTEGGTAAATVARTTTPRPSPPPSAGPGPASSCASSTTTATTCRPARPGEILLRGGSVMSHYLDDPEATAAALSADGWLRTGDLGVVDERGCLRIVGRSKDMFIVGGFNAYPAEIENALLRHPDIQQAAVIGIPDERLGEVGMAFVVLAPGTTPDAATRSSRGAATQMANYKVPRARRARRRAAGERHRQGREGRAARAGSRRDDRERLLHDGAASGRPPTGSATGTPSWPATSDVVLRRARRAEPTPSPATSPTGASGRATGWR